MIPDGLDSGAWPPGITARSIDQSADLACVATTDGRLREVTGSWSGLLGRREEELLSSSLVDLVDEIDHDNCTILTGQVMSERSFDHVEITFVAKGGRGLPVDGNATGRFRDGRFVATHTFFRDVSDRKNAVALQAAYQRQLEEEVAQRSAALVQSEKLTIPSSTRPARRGVVAVGDVRASSIKRVALAVGEGSVVLQVVYQVLRD